MRCETRIISRGASSVTKVKKKRGDDHVDVNCVTRNKKEAMYRPLTGVTRPVETSTRLNSFFTTEAEEEEEESPYEEGVRTQKDKNERRVI